MFKRFQKVIDNYNLSLASSFDFESITIDPTFDLSLSYSGETYSENQIVDTSNGINFESHVNFTWSLEGNQWWVRVDVTLYQNATGGPIQLSRTYATLTYDPLIHSTYVDKYDFATFATQELLNAFYQTFYYDLNINGIYTQLIF